MPVILQTYNYVLEPDVDYVKVQLPGNRSTTQSSGSFATNDFVAGSDHDTWVPTILTLTCMLQIQPNPKKVRDTFDLEKFKRGDLVNEGFK